VGGHERYKTPKTPPTHLNPAPKARHIPAWAEGLGKDPRRRRYLAAAGRSEAAGATTKLPSSTRPQNPVKPPTFLKTSKPRIITAPDHARILAQPPHPIL